MARDRDVAAFGRRAPRYDEGWRGQLHHQIADRTADLALSCVPAPRRILDVGCGTGYLLSRLAAQAPQAEVLAGIDAAPAMIGAAKDAATDDRLEFVVGTAEQLPWPAAAFDLVVSTTSFDHWVDQETGLAQIPAMRQYTTLWKGGLADAPGWLTSHGWQTEFHPLAALGSSYGRPIPDAASGGFLTATRIHP